jgi:hypothetical protein
MNPKVSIHPTVFLRGSRAAGRRAITTTFCNFVQDRTGHALVGSAGTNVYRIDMTFGYDQSILSQFPNLSILALIGAGVSSGWPTATVEELSLR